MSTNRQAMSMTPEEEQRGRLTEIERELARELVELRTENASLRAYARSAQEGVERARAELAAIREVDAVATVLRSDPRMALPVVVRAAVASLAQHAKALDAESTSLREGIEAIDAVAAILADARCEGHNMPLPIAVRAVVERLAAKVNAAEVQADQLRAEVTRQRLRSAKRTRKARAKR
jgi:hypothetical protein